MSTREKRKRESSEDRLRRKIKKYERKLEKVCSRQWPPSPAPTPQSMHTDDDEARTPLSPHHNEENNFIGSAEPNDENTGIYLIAF